jgi:amino acid transporter
MPTPTSIQYMVVIFCALSMVRFRRAVIRRQPYWFRDSRDFMIAGTVAQAIYLTLRPNQQAFDEFIILIGITMFLLTNNLRENRPEEFMQRLY